MKYDIPTDEARYRKCVQKVQLRMLRSSIWSMNRRLEWVRFLKMYRKVVDFVPEPDEPHLTLGYLFGLIEQNNAKISEPLLGMSIPFAVYPRGSGDGQAADNFSQIYRHSFAQPNYQEAMRRSMKLMGIIGPRFEVDEWLNVKRPGFMWGKVPQEVKTPLLRGDGTPLMRKDGTPAFTVKTQLVPGEVPVSKTVHCGFNTRFPSPFDMYPEPDRATFGTGAPTDCSWCVEDMSEMAIEELAHQKYVDANGAEQPVYDFSRLMAERGTKARERYERFMKGGSDYAEDSYGTLIVPTGKWNLTTDYHQIDKDTQYPTEGTVNRQSSEDRDKVLLVRHYEANEILTIANGKFIVQRVTDPWHTPGLKMRIENYTSDPEFLYGQGMVQPIEDEILAMGDSFNMSYSNAIRLINKMVAIREDAIVTMEDFKPRAGGKIRIQGVSDVRSAISEIQQRSVIPEMMSLHSILSGEIEFVSSNLDGAPGVQGSKPGHKTNKGLQTLQVNYATRFITNQASALINQARRGLSMEQFFSQFAFEKQSYRCLRDDGSTVLAEFDKDDVYTEGRGFDFVIEVDPLWGNTAAQRQNALDAYEHGAEYEKMRRDIQDPSMRKLNLDKLYERVLKLTFGLRDTSSIFTAPDGTMTPANEEQIIARGGVVRCGGDLQEHIVHHLAYMNSPQLADAIKNEKVHPDTKKNIGLLIQEDRARLVAFLKDPEGAVQKRMNEVGLVHPDQAGGARG